MNCSKCGGVSSVIDSRLHGPFIRRRRICDACEYRWSTVEAEADMWTLRHKMRAAGVPVLRQFRANTDHDNGQKLS